MEEEISIAQKIEKVRAIVDLVEKSKVGEPPNENDEQSNNRKKEYEQYYFN